MADQSSFAKRVKAVELGSIPRFISNDLHLELINVARNSSTVEELDDNFAIIADQYSNILDYRLRYLWFYTHVDWNRIPGIELQYSDLSPDMQKIVDEQAVEYLTSTEKFIDNINKYRTDLDVMIEENVIYTNHIKSIYDEVDRMPVQPDIEYLIDNGIVAEKYIDVTLTIYNIPELKHLLNLMVTSSRLPILYWASKDSDRPIIKVHSSYHSEISNLEVTRSDNVYRQGYNEFIKGYIRLPSTSTKSNDRLVLITIVMQSDTCVISYRLDCKDSSHEVRSIIDNSLPSEVADSIQQSISKSYVASIPAQAFTREILLDMVLNDPYLSSYLYYTDDKDYTLSDNRSEVATKTNEIYMHYNDIIKGNDYQIRISYIKYTSSRPIPRNLQALFYTNSNMYTQIMMRKIPNIEIAISVFITISKLLDIYRMNEKIVSMQYYQLDPKFKLEVPKRVEIKNPHSNTYMYPEIFPKRSTRKLQHPVTFVESLEGLDPNRSDEYVGPDGTLHYIYCADNRFPTINYYPGTEWGVSHMIPHCLATVARGETKAGSSILTKKKAAAEDQLGELDENIEYLTNRKNLYRLGMNREDSDISFLSCILYSLDIDGYRLANEDARQQIRNNELANLYDFIDKYPWSILQENCYGNASRTNVLEPSIYIRVLEYLYNIQIIVFTRALKELKSRLLSFRDNSLCVKVDSNTLTRPTVLIYQHFGGIYASKVCELLVLNKKNALFNANSAMVTLLINKWIEYEAIEYVDMQFTNEPIAQEVDEYGHVIGLYFSSSDGSVLHAATSTTMPVYPSLPLRNTVESNDLKAIHDTFGANIVATYNDRIIVKGNESIDLIFRLSEFDITKELDIFNAYKLYNYKILHYSIYYIATNYPDIDNLEDVVEYAMDNALVVPVDDTSHTKTLPYIAELPYMIDTSLLPFKLVERQRRWLFEQLTNVFNNQSLLVEQYAKMDPNKAHVIGLYNNIFAFDRYESEHILSNDEALYSMISPKAVIFNTYIRYDVRDKIQFFSCVISSKQLYFRCKVVDPKRMELATNNVGTVYTILVFDSIGTGDIKTVGTIKANVIVTNQHEENSDKYYGVFIDNLDGSLVIRHIRMELIHDVATM